MKAVVLGFLFAVLAFEARVEASADVIKAMYLNYVKGLNDCKKELSLPDSIDEDFKSVWDSGYTISSRQTGCAIACLGTKTGVLEKGAKPKLNHDKYKQYVKDFGADESVASSSDDVTAKCEQSVPQNDDSCARVRDMFTCYRDGLEKLGWAPKLTAGEKAAIGAKA